MVLPEGLDDGRPHEAKVSAEGREDEGRDGKDEEVEAAERGAAGRDVARPARRQHPELDREDDDEDEGEPEHRHRHSGEGDEVDDAVVPGEWPHRGQGPGRERDGKGEDEAGAEEDEGVREGRAEHVEDGGRVQPRVSEVAARGVRHPRPPPFEDGAVEAMQGLEADRVLGSEVGVRRHHEVDGVPRHEADEGIYRERHDPEDQRSLPQPADDERGHAVRRPGCDGDAGVVAGAVMATLPTAGAAFSAGGERPRRGLPTDAGLSARKGLREPTALQYQRTAIRHSGPDPSESDFGRGCHPARAARMSSRYAERKPARE